MKNTSLPALRGKSFWDLENLFKGTFDGFFDIFKEDFNNMFDVGLYETDEGYVYEVEVPGFTKDNIEVELCDGVLSIKGERKMPSKNAVGLSKVRKAITIGNLNVKDATIENGILRILIEKESQEKEVEKIEIKS